jgi:hypothetical protein
LLHEEIEAAVLEVAATYDMQDSAGIKARLDLDLSKIVHNVRVHCCLNLTVRVLAVAAASR